MSTTTEPLDHAQIDLLLSLDEGEGGALTEIVDEYLTLAERSRVDLYGALGRHDAEAVARTAHTLKGASANVGAGHLATVCGEIERYAREDRLQDTGGCFGHFESEFARVTEALRAVLAGL